MNCLCLCSSRKCVFHAYSLFPPSHESMLPRQVDDALKIFLRLIVVQSENKTIRKLLARSLNSPLGLELLRGHLPDQELSSNLHAGLQLPTRARCSYFTSGVHAEPLYTFQESSAVALAFLATIVKEHSGIDNAIDLYEQVSAPLMRK